MPGVNATFAFRRLFRFVLSICAASVLFAANSVSAFAQNRPTETGGEANLIIPDLTQATFFGGAINGHNLLLYSLVIVALGLVFGIVDRKSVV